MGNATLARQVTGHVDQPEDELYASDEWMDHFGGNGGSPNVPRYKRKTMHKRSPMSIVSSTALGKKRRGALPPTVKPFWDDGDAGDGVAPNVDADAGDDVVGRACCGGGPPPAQVAGAGAALVKPVAKVPKVGVNVLKGWRQGTKSRRQGCRCS